MFFNSDLFSCVLDHIPPHSETIQRLLTALPPSHAYFQLTLAHRLRHIAVSSDIAPAKAYRLLECFESRRERARSVHRLDVLSSKTPAGTAYNRLHDNPDELSEFSPNPNLPPLLAQFTNLQELRWEKRCDIPEECLVLLALLQSLRTAHLDCTSVMRLGSETWDIVPFLTSVGPRLTTLVLQSLDEKAFTAFYNVAPLLGFLRSLKLDITYGSWDWDGLGSPQLGASDHYAFMPLEGLSNLTQFTLIASDLSMRPRDSGPLNIIRGSSLQELHLNVINCFGWTCIRRIKAFQAIDAHEFANLTHLSIMDEVFNPFRMSWNFPRGTTSVSHIGLGRIYYGLLDFISELPGLKRLWLDESALVVLDYPLPRQEVEDDAWESFSPFLLAVDSMRSPAWLRLVESGVLQQLDSLRVGLGPLDERGINTLFSSMGRNSLVEFGFEWNWKAFDKEQPISPGLLALLQSFDKLTDVHITYPRPDTVDQRTDRCTLQDVGAIFGACPSVCRVGIGNSCVWERGVDLQLVDAGQVSKFYTAGFQRRPIEEGGEDRVIDELLEALETS